MPVLNVSYKPQKISPKFKVGVPPPHSAPAAFSEDHNTPHQAGPSPLTSLSPQGSVRALLHDKIRDAYTHPQFVTDVMKPMQIESIIDQDVSDILASSWRPQVPQLAGFVACQHWTTCFR